MGRILWQPVMGQMQVERCNCCVSGSELLQNVGNCSLFVDLWAINYHLMGTYPTATSRPRLAQKDAGPW